jgi:peptide deformylase
LIPKQVIEAGGRSAGGFVRLSPRVADAMYEELQIIHWPDPRLKKVSTEVVAFDDNLKALANRMLELMRLHRGVGLAAPQVGINWRLFVMNATGLPEDDRIYVNPILTEADGEEEAEEGCLSLPEINANIWRAKNMHLEARDVSGQPVSENASAYIARIWQHEFDHLNGTLLTDRMGPVAKLASRRKLKELEAKYNEMHKIVPKTKKKRA